MFVNALVHVHVLGSVHMPLRVQVLVTCMTPAHKLVAGEVATELCGDKRCHLSEFDGFENEARAKSESKS